jgi:hypothetical protein
MLRTKNKHHQALNTFLLKDRFLTSSSNRPIKTPSVFAQSIDKKIKNERRPAEFILWIWEH